MKKPRKVFPVALILTGKPCLVLGGGKVATRKVKLLLEADAAVTVVSPAVSAELRKLADANAILWIPRAFETADMDGIFLVYAATSSRIANRAALNLCRRRGIMCCPVDDAWVDGDFLTPATVRDGDLTIAVNTAGHACRRSRLVKQSIARHAGFVTQADLLVIGVSHDQLDIASLEALQPGDGGLDGRGRMIFRVWGIHEFLILATCNRIELHAVGVPDQEGLALLLRILDFDRLPPGSCYVKTGWDAFEHTCALCAGLFSQMPCEYHIVAQFKDALKTAIAREWAGGMMQEWTDAALHVSAHMRAHFESSSGDREIEDAALDYLEQTAPEAASGSRLLLLGTGRLGASVLKRAAARFKFGAIEWFWRRTPPPLPVSTTPPVSLHPLRSLKDRLPGAGVVICALSATQPVISTADLQAAGTDGKPLVILDLGVPRNVETGIGNALPARIRILDLDELKRWCRRESTDVARLQEQCRGLVLEHKAYYDKLVASFQGRNARQ